MANDEPGRIVQRVGLLRRLAAILYDLFLLTALWWLVTAAFLLLTDGEAIQRGSTLFYLYQLALITAALLFFVGFWSHGGQTLGMRAWRFKVVRNDGARMRYTDSLKRAAAALVSLAPAGCGFWWAAIDPESLAWHDRWSGSRLLRLA